MPSYEDPVFVTVTNDLYTDTIDENENHFEELLDNPYFPVIDISLTSLQETMYRLQYGDRNYMNEEEYTLNLETDEEEENTLKLEEDEDTLLHEEEEDVMIQEDNEVQ